MEVDFPSDDNGEMYDIFALEVVNVFVCTAPENVILALNQQDGTGGCLSSEIDPDGPYNVIINGIVEQNYEAEIIPYSDEPNKVRFSFLTLATPRTTIYVHVQIELSLSEAEIERRRLQGKDVDDDVVGQGFRHFLATATVEEGQAETADSEVESVMEAASSVRGIASLFLILSASLLLL